MTSQDLVLRAIFMSGYVQRAHKESIRDSTSALLYRYNQILTNYYKRGQSEQCIQSLAYIQLNKLLTQLIKSDKVNL